MISDPRTAAPENAATDPADTPLLAVLRDFEREGFTAQFDSRDGGIVHCFACGADHRAAACHHGDIVRLEGASDPADMLAVIPARCPNCGSLGVLVATYGPDSSAADAEVLRELDRAPAGREDGA